MSSRFIDTSAGRVFVVERGPASGPPTVFLHGFMMSQLIWTETLRLLDGQGRRMVAVDLPGFGESDRPDPSGFAYDLPALAKILGEVLDALKAPVVELVGHSLGGAVALTLAARQPERVSRQVLISPAILPLPLPFEGRVLLTPGLGWLLWSRVPRAEVRRQMLRDHFRDPAPVTDDLVDHIWARLNRPGGREASYAVLQTLGGLREENPDIEAVRAPTLLVWPDEDRVVPAAIGRRLAARIAGAELRIVPACGHNTPLERPAELSRLLTGFLAARQNPPVELRG